jgi:hypothetical protein
MADAETTAQMSKIRSMAAFLVMVGRKPALII